MKVAVGVGKWILKLMKDFFVDANADAEIEERIQRVEKNKGSRKYVPQKNSAAYALLITLYRGTSDGVEFMRKQELIDAAEASGLSRTPIMPEIGKGKAGQFGVSSGREWYSGWNCMKNLIDKGLAVKSSCPAKYMLTEQGKEAARDCRARSGLSDSTEGLATINKTSDPVIEPVSTHAQLVEDSPPQRASIMRTRKNQWICPPETLSIRYTLLVRILDTPNNKLPCVFLRFAKKSPNEETSFTDQNVRKRGRNNLEDKSNILSMPPLSFGDRFKDVYEVVLILDDREKFTREIMLHNNLSSTSLGFKKREALKSVKGQNTEARGDEAKAHASRRSQRSSKLLQQVKLHFKIPIEVRRLPVGDGIWIARHKQLGSEYVLDFIVERKNVDDLRSSISDNRYREQKVRILVMLLSLLATTQKVDISSRG
ncbi:restriction endonuclease, type II-like superfamily protein [Artemisia annua]|uniref:Crossover junction endonuclease MUS81 n=1 Tax=Artemisia annua TaxID=35608 RepID=A0A2U1P8N1_ARTAN|nr:restriction endonuclease, type II-like superfamily protein [Artemisia annua]